MSQFCWFRLTFTNGKYSTTEKHYYSVPTETIDAAAITVAQQFIRCRIMLLGGNCYLDDIEIGDDLNPQSTIKFASFGHTVGLLPLPAGAAPAKASNPFTVSPALQIGTAYLRCPEAQISPLYRQALKGSRDNETAITNVFTGRPARAIVNRFMREVGPMSDLAPEFPLAAATLAPLRAKSEMAGSTDFTPLWSGQSARLSRELPAADLTKQLAAETLKNLALLQTKA